MRSSPRGTDTLHRLARRAALATSLVSAALVPACAPACPSADRAALPATAGEVRFVSASSARGLALVTLFDAQLLPVEFPLAGAAATTSWIATQSRWEGSRGRGIGGTPLLPSALSPIPARVTIAGASSVFALDLGTPPADWEWVEPTSDEGTLPPILDVLVVQRDAPDHDLALVARDRIPHGETPFGGPGSIGGDLLVLDVETPTPALLGSVSLDGIAAEPLLVTPRAITYANGLAYVALAQGVVLGPTGSPITRRGEGVVVTVDLETRMVRHTLRLTGYTECGGIVAGGTEGQVIVACAGVPASPGAIPTDGGLLLLARDPAPMSAGAPIVQEAFPATGLNVPSPDRGLLALAGPWVAFVSTGSTEGAPIDDRLFAVNLDTQRVELLATAPTDRPSAPGGLGTGAFDRIPQPVDMTLRLVVPAGYDGFYTWTMPTDPALLASDPFGPRVRVPFVACDGGPPVRAIRLVTPAPPPAP